LTLGLKVKIGAPSKPVFRIAKSSVAVRGEQGSTQGVSLTLPDAYESTTYSSEKVNPRNPPTNLDSGSNNSISNSILPLAYELVIG
jgi:hypothetical protein